jgi:hypothetical protein
MTMPRPTAPDMPRFQSHPKQETPGQSPGPGFSMEPLSDSNRRPTQTVSVRVVQCPVVPLSDVFPDQSTSSRLSCATSRGVVQRRPATGRPPRALRPWATPASRVRPAGCGNPTRCGERTAVCPGRRSETRGADPIRLGEPCRGEGAESPGAGDGRCVTAWGRTDVFRHPERTLATGEVGSRGRETALIPDSAGPGRRRPAMVTHVRKPIADDRNGPHLAGCRLGR